MAAGAPGPIGDHASLWTHQSIAEMAKKGEAGGAPVNAVEGNAQEIQLRKNTAYMIQAALKMAYVARKPKSFKNL